MDPNILKPNAILRDIYNRYLFADEYAVACTIFYIFYPYENLYYDENTY